MRHRQKNIAVGQLTTYGTPRAVRLPDSDYADNADIHVTICAAAGAPFAEDAVAAMVCHNVEFYCEKLGFLLHGYCLMPDHLHVLLSPADSEIKLDKWLDVFKSYTTHEFMKQGRHAPLWQRSAHDHVCRKGETAETVLAYIVDNPVRAGLVKEWVDWPWTKAFTAM
ncbi:MAG: transposase, partial [Planctomycetes bacterium]|nr:transposase [Planctomycetota bacterium]